MNKFSKLIAIVLLIVIGISNTVCAATFSDVKEDSAYYEAVEELSELGIVAGYTDGTFRPENVITRAEAAAIIIRLQGLEEVANTTAKSSESAFNDVKKTDWFFGYVTLASQMGIVSGDGDGTFRPNDLVKQEEMIKLLVAACGVNMEMAFSRGGWPTGYIKIARELGMYDLSDEYVGENANRGIVAKMTKGALYAPHYIQNSTGKATINPDASFIKSVFGGQLSKEEKTENKAEENVPVSPLETYEAIRGITTKSAFLKYQGKRLQNEFKYDNDSYILEYEAVLNYIKNDTDRTAIVKLVATNAYDRTNAKETEVEITIPANTDEYNFVQQIDFKKIEWFDIVGNDLLNEKDSDILFSLYVNNEKINEFKKTFSYQYSAEKSVADTFKIYDAQMETLNSKDDVVQKGNQIVKYANVAGFRFLSNVSIDKSSEEENIDVFHIDMKIYEDFGYDKATKKISGRLESWYGFSFCPATGDKFGFTYGGEYRVGSFRSGSYTMVFSLYGEIIYTYDFKVVNP